MKQIFFSETDPPYPWRPVSWRFSRRGRYHGGFILSKTLKRNDSIVWVLWLKIPHCRGEDDGVARLVDHREEERTIEDDRGRGRGPGAPRGEARDRGSSCGGAFGVDLDLDGVGDVLEVDAGGVREALEGGGAREGGGHGG